MRFGSQIFDFQFLRSSIAELVFLLIVSIAPFVAARFIVANDLAALAEATVVFAVLAVVVLTLNNWRTGFYLFLFWLLFEDLARKFLGNNMAIYFAKDFLLAVVYISFVIHRRRNRDGKPFRLPFRIALLLLIWFGIIQMFNPASPSLAFGIMGMKLFFCYVPLAIVGYYLVNSESDLRKFFYVNLGLMLVITTLGIAQSLIGPRFLNPEILADDIRSLSEAYRVAPISGAIVYRPTSVFVSAGRFADMLMVAWMMVFGFSGYLLLRHRRGRLLSFVGLGITAAGCLMCASRGVFVWTLGSSVVAVLAFIWGAPWRQGEALRMVRVVQRVLMGVALAIVVLLFAYPEAFLGRLAVYSETLDPRSSKSELFHRAGNYPLANFLAAFDYPRWPYGYGIGTTSNGVQYVYRFFHVRPPVSPVESGFGAIVLEMGIVGLALWIIMSVSILLSAWKVVRSLKGSPWFPLAFMIFWYALILLLPMTFVAMTPYQDFIMNAYLWLLLGILFRLPKLALSAQQQPHSADLIPSNPWSR
jgi:hypothetical protein